MSAETHDALPLPSVKMENTAPTKSAAPSSARLPGLDLLRAIAILWVMLFHARFDPMPHFLRPIASLGWMGVDLFFVLSGYLIATQLLRPYTIGARPSLRDFYVRRFFRIIPAYWATLLLYLTIPAFSEDAHLTATWKYLSFTQNLLFDYRFERGFGHAWSLCVEEHFYLLLPCILMLLMIRPSLRKAAVCVVAILAAEIAIRAWICNDILRQPWSNADKFSIYFQRIYYATYSQLDALTLGVAVAGVKVFRAEWWRRMTAHGHLWLAASVGFMTIYLEALSGLVFSTALGFTMLALSLTCLLISSVSQNGWLARVRVPGAAATATLAYSMYLTHPAVMHLVRDYCLPHWKLPPMITPLVFGIFCFGAAAVLYWCVEFPFLRLRERLSAGLKKKQAAAVALAGNA